MTTVMPAPIQVAIEHNNICVMAKESRSNFIKLLLSTCMSMRIPAIDKDNTTSSYIHQIHESSKRADY